MCAGRQKQRVFGTDQTSFRSTMWREALPPKHRHLSYRREQLHTKPLKVYFPSARLLSLGARGGPVCAVQTNERMPALMRTHARTPSRAPGPWARALYTFGGTRGLETRGAPQSTGRKTQRMVHCTPGRGKHSGPRHGLGGIADDKSAHSCADRKGSVECVDEEGIDTWVRIARRVWTDISGRQIRQT